MSENIPFPLISEICDMNMYEIGDNILLSLTIYDLFYSNNVPTKYLRLKCNNDKVSFMLS